MPYNYWYEQLFDLIAPVTMTAEKFEEIWPLVSCVYKEEVQRYLKINQYECRLRQLPPNRDLESDIEETTAFLTEKGRLHRQFTAKDPDETERWGLVFAEPGQQISHALQPIINMRPEEIINNG
jgi:hypothetical protein